MFYWTLSAILKATDDDTLREYLEGKSSRELVELLYVLAETDALDGVAEKLGLKPAPREAKCSRPIGHDDLCASAWGEEVVYWDSSLLMTSFSVRCDESLNGKVCVLPFDHKSGGLINTGCEFDGEFKPCLKTDESRDEEQTA